MHSCLAAAAMIAAAGLSTTPAPAQNAGREGPGRITVQPVGGPVSPKVDEILTRLEDRKVADLHARIQWDQMDDLSADDDAIDRRRGEIWYTAKDVAVPKFLIRFNERTSAGRRDKLDEQYMFDGVWYVELKNNTVTRRQVRDPNAPGDPFKLGEGPFPVPFGQKKADIIREFDVVLEPSDRSDPKDTDHLKLTPRPGTRLEGKYGELHFYIRRSGKEAGLPVKIKLGKLDANASFAVISAWTVVEFNDARLDRGVKPDMFEIKKPPGGVEIVEPLELPEP
jgi:hypothetical protein